MAFFRRPHRDLLAAVDNIRVSGDGAPGIAFAIIRRGRIAFAGAVGKRVLDDSGPDGGPPLTANTKLRVASISKLAVAMGAMRMMEAGRLNVDAPIDERLPFPMRYRAWDDTPVTTAMLLAHTGTVRDGENYFGVLGETLADFLTPGGKHWEKGGHVTPQYRPGDYFTYSNLGYGVAATVMEAAAGARFDQLMRLSVFAPLGLSCGFNWSGVPAEQMAQGAALYRKDAAGRWNASVDAPGTHKVGPAFTLDGASLDGYKPGQNGLLFGPQGGLRASVREIAELGCVLMDGASRGRRLLKPETVDKMTTPIWRFDPKALNGDTEEGNGDTYDGSMQAYGLGVHVLTGSDRGDGPIPGMAGPLVGHLGDAYGLLGGLWVDRARRAGFVYLTSGGPENDKRTRGKRSAFFAVEEELMALLYDAAMPGARGG